MTNDQWHVQLSKYSPAISRARETLNISELSLLSSKIFFQLTYNFGALYVFAFNYQDIAIIEKKKVYWKFSLQESDEMTATSCIFPRTFDRIHYGS